MNELFKYDTVEIVTKDQSFKGFILACFSNYGKEDANITQVTLLHHNDMLTINYTNIKDIISKSDFCYLKIYPSRCVLFEKDMSNKLNTPANEL
jgi:hypothetical protein